jgi:hypothetical protein
MKCSWLAISNPQRRAAHSSIGRGASTTLTEADYGRKVLVYRRSWETDVPPERTFEVSVEVR